MEFRYFICWYFYCSVHYSYTILIFWFNYFHHRSMYGSQPDIPPKSHFERNLGVKEVYQSCQIALVNLQLKFDNFCYNPWSTRNLQTQPLHLLQKVSGMIVEYNALGMRSRLSIQRLRTTEAGIVFRDSGHNTSPSPHDTTPSPLQGVCDMSHREAGWEPIWAGQRLAKRSHTFPHSPTLINPCI